MNTPSEDAAHRRTGIEQEFVVSRAGAAVDFRSYARAGRLPGRRLDADDPHAHRQGHGGVITADGAEAEIATHPEVLRHGFTDALHDAVGRLHRDLDTALEGEGVAVRGVSTHLNVEVTDRAAPGTARRFVDRHAAAMMLLLDRTDSPGLLVRPRRGRLEIGGEYACGSQLKAAMVFAAAATLDAERPGFAPTRSHPVLEPARLRYGWYVDRHAFGPDLYRDGRAARIGHGTAQDLLEASWARCRGRVEDQVSSDEVTLVDDLVAGRRPLPCEQPEPFPFGVEQSGRAGPVPAPVDLTLDRILGPVTVRPLMATWDHVALAVVGAGSTRYVALPITEAEVWMDRFSAGALTAWCLDLLAAPAASLPVLLSVDDVGRGRAFGSIAKGASLSRAERDPVTGQFGNGLPPGDARQHKHDQHQHDPHGSQQPSRPRKVRVRRMRPRARPRRWWPAAAGGSAAVVLVISSAVALTHGGGTASPAASEGPTGGGLTGGGLTGGGPTGGVLPSSPVSSTPPQKADEPLARSLVGTYDVTAVVTRGNGSLTVGMTNRYKMKLKLDCEAPDRCTVASSGTAATLSGGALTFEGNPTEPCPDGGGGTVTDHYVLRLEPQDGSFSRLVGTEFLESIDVSECKNVGTKPVRYSVVAVRR